jgi:hypothetical protein
VCPPATFSEDAFEPVPIKVQQQRFWDHAKGRAANRPDVLAAKARRERVLELADGTRDQVELARLMNTTVPAIRGDIKALRAQGHEVPMSRGVSYEANADRLLALVKEGASNRGAAAALGISWHTVGKWRARLRAEGRL